MNRDSPDSAAEPPAAPLRRRQFLAGAAGVGSALTAGCAFTDVPDETVLVGVEVSNRTDESIEAELLVTRYDDVVRWERPSVPAADTVGIDLSVPEEPGRFDVYVRVGDRSAANEVSPRYDSDCVSLDVVVTADEFRFVRAAADC